MKEHIDERGTIRMVMESCVVGSISIIESNPDSIRANHFHLKDGHNILITEGQIVMYERIKDSEDRPIRYVLDKGDLHFTPPGVEHCMYFPCFTIFHCYSLLPRNEENYEDQTVRLGFCLKEIYDNYNIIKICECV